MKYPKVSDHFVITEFVPPEIWAAFGERSRWFIDPRLVAACEAIRVHYNKPVIVNSWHYGGKYKESGYRVPNTETGGYYSQHKAGRAGDLKIVGETDYEKVRDVMRKNWKKFGITTIELGTDTWLHVDVRDTGLATLYEVPYQ